MDLVRIGKFLQELRREKGLTQEQLAAKMGVARRTVSRWETGSNMPDLDILTELADFYAVDLREILSGERKNTQMAPELRETVMQVADYSKEEKTRCFRRIRGRSLLLLILGFLFAVICLWRFSPHAFMQILPAAEPRGITGIRTRAEITSAGNGGLQTDAYAADFFKGDEGWSEILWLLASSTYRKDLRGPFLPLFNGFSTDSGDKAVSLSLRWSSDAEHWDCTLLFPSDRLLIVSFADGTPPCIFHPSDRSLLDRLSEYVRLNGKSAK